MAVVVQPPVAAPESPALPASIAAGGVIGRASAADAPVPAAAAAPRNRFWWDVGLGAGLMTLLHLFVLQVSIVKGHSMEPSLCDGDRLVVDRITASLGEVGRGDVVVLRYPRNIALDFVKRIVGLPGDRVAMRAGQVYVNGIELADQFTCIEDHQDMSEVEVPQGSYFVLGDNRPISCDSREFGLVSQDLIKGRVRCRFWPLDRVAVF